MEHHDPSVGPDRAPGRMAGLLGALFFGAFNDNAFKIIVYTLAMRAIVAEHGPSGTDYDSASQTLAMITMQVITLPMLLFSLPAGVLADRLSKRTVIVATKALEVVLMAAAAACLLLAPHQLLWLMVILGLMGLQSALFGPAKYGILPELVSTERLAASNAAVETATMLAIIAGTGLGPVLLSAAQAAPDATTGTRADALAVAALAGFAIVGLVCACMVPRVAAAAPATTGENASGAASASAMQTLKSAAAAIRSDRPIALAVAGSVLFWAVLSFIGQNILVYSKAITELLNNGAALAGLPTACFGIGIAVGAMLAAKLSAKRIEYGLIPLGAIFFSLVMLLLAIVQPGGLWTLCAIMVLLGAAAGMIIVPLHAVLQHRAPDDCRGSVIATSNMLSYAGMIGGSLLGGVLAGQFALSPASLFYVGALTVAIGTAWAFYLLPEAGLRLAVVLLTRTVYRVRLLDVHHVPETGGALLVPNHVSYVDALLLTAATERPIRFLVHESMYEKPWLNPLLRLARAVPVSSTGGPRSLLAAMRQARKLLDSGELVCIFAEGSLGRTGMLGRFNRGMERIVKNSDAPIVPIYMAGLSGSIFAPARRGLRFLRRLPRELPYRVTIAFGAPVPSTTTAHEVRSLVQDLSETAWRRIVAEHPPLHHRFIKVARRSGSALAVSDGLGRALSRRRMLIGAIAMARHLRGVWRDQPHVGLLLPPSTAGAVANLAAALAGKVSVNLNYTTGPAGMASAIEQAGITSVLTSRQFIQKAQLELPERLRVIQVEDLARELGAGAKLAAMLLAHLAPLGMLQRACGAERLSRIEDPVTVIFSSGSTGDPKGVVLTHMNVDANVQGVSEFLATTPDDRLLGILPLFHSFGYMTLWLALHKRVAIICHANPLDPLAIGEIVEKARVTILIATPTFLNIYLRRCEPGQFGSLRFVLTGAEKLPTRLADTFAEEFGIRPIEGYGATECAPVIATSTLPYRAPGLFQAGSKAGSVGRPLPGIAVRLVDPETRAPVEPGSPGLLLVRGPNIMRGYLGRPDLTDAVLQDGWYTTGDIASFDEDGFLRITDRLSRFSKIGGEMVPHGKVEQALMDAAEVDSPTFAVTALPDERKGERLAVLHTLAQDVIPELVQKLQASGLPNLFIPRPEQFIKVPELPLLGTGKLDLRAIKAIAQAHAASTGKPVGTS